MTVGGFEPTVFSSQLRSSHTSPVIFYQCDRTRHCCSIQELFPVECCCSSLCFAPGPHKGCVCSMFGLRTQVSVRLIRSMTHELWNQPRLAPVQHTPVMSAQHSLASGQLFPSHVGHKPFWKPFPMRRRALHKTPMSQNTAKPFLHPITHNPTNTKRSLIRFINVARETENYGKLKIFHRSQYWEAFLAHRCGAFTGFAFTWSKQFLLCCFVLHRTPE